MSIEILHNYFNTYEILCNLKIFSLLVILIIAAVYSHDSQDSRNLKKRIETLNNVSN